MIKRIKSEKLKGGYTMGKAVTVSVCQLEENLFEIVAMYDDGEELDCERATTEADALMKFAAVFNKHAEPLQKAFYSADLVEGGKYTIVYIGDFGFPIVQKIIYHGMECSTYAQYSDCVKLTYRGYKKRSGDVKRFYNCSVMIFEGWQEVAENVTHEMLKDDGVVRMTKSKYGCFDSRYLDDIEKVLKNPVVIYKNYKNGVNGKSYA